MDQTAQLVTYQRLLLVPNASGRSDSPYNFSSADSILEEFHASQLTLHNFSTVILLTLYLPIFVVGLAGNALIIISVAKERTFRKAKNYFFINLAVADLCVTILCMPMTVSTIVYKLWIYGEFLCKMTTFMQGVAVGNSIFTLTAMSIDRYISIQHPAIAQRVTSPGQALFIILSIWIVSGLFMGPLLYIRLIETPAIPGLPPLDFCVEKWPQAKDRMAYSLFLLFVVFIVPATTLVTCYAQIGKVLFTNDMARENSDSSLRSLFSRKRAARMLIILVIVFMVCWLPYNVISLVIDLVGEAEQIHILAFSLWLGHAHSAINPLMYWWLNKRFRYRVRRMVKSCFTPRENKKPRQNYV